VTERLSKKDAEAVALLADRLLPADVQAVAREAAAAVPEVVPVTASRLYFLLAALLGQDSLCRSALLLSAAAATAGYAVGILCAECRHGSRPSQQPAGARQA
jgi:hypothetical protein